MPSQKQEKGFKAENLARGYLELSGYEILAQNWRHGHLEVDLVARIANELVVVEVKSRKAWFIENETDLLPFNKQRALAEAAEAYLMENHLDLDVRFDLMVVLGDENHQIKHLTHAFFPEF